MEGLAGKEKAGESMNGFIDMYINSYYDKSITNMRGNAIQNAVNSQNSFWVSKFVVSVSSQNFGV